MPEFKQMWVFNGARSTFPAGVFSTLEHAEEWIRERGLSGVVTAYPLDVGVYDWALTNDYFAPKEDRQRLPAFIQTFTSSRQKHYHYVDGARDC